MINYQINGDVIELSNLSICTRHWPFADSEIFKVQLTRQLLVELNEALDWHTGRLVCSKRVPHTLTYAVDEDEGLYEFEEPFEEEVLLEVNLKLFDSGRLDIEISAVEFWDSLLWAELGNARQLLRLFE